MQRGMTLLCKMWKPAADDYIAFLARNEIECFGIHVLHKELVEIYVDEEKYLKLSVYNKKFEQDEKQLIRLLKGIETLVEKYIELLVKNNNNNDLAEQSFLEDMEEKETGE